MLASNNKINYLKRSLAAELLKLFFEDKIESEINTIPLRRVPKYSQPVSCCIFKDRAMIRSQIMALLGMNMEEDDETKDLLFFFKKAIEREEVESPILTVIDIACHSCEKGQYYVTEVCQGCLAKPCESNCPVKAIKAINGRAKIDQNKCVRCGRCQEMCPYNAIVYKSVPCEESCPAGAISRNPQTGKADIDYDKCIYCGKCTKSCPFGAITDRSQIIDVAKRLKNKENVIALVAPSIVGQFPGNILQAVSSLKKLGFSEVHEVAYGADLAAQHEAKEFMDEVKSGKQKMISNSCCTAWVETVKKHLPEFSSYISKTPSPMAFIAHEIKEKNPSSITVFIGPCVAKKFEALHNQNVDYVLTFEELGAFLVAKEIEVAELGETSFDSPDSTGRGRSFPITGGVSEAVKRHLNDSEEMKVLKIDGLNKSNIFLLKRTIKEKDKFNFVEVMACENGCIGGPGVISNPKISKRKIEDYSARTV